jgi:flagellar basal-body rod modification protein FlgD
MSTVQGTSSATSAATTGVAATSTAQSTEDRFLQLLVAQMKNQDPLNPMDNAQVTSQMAQLSTVTGIEKLNASLQSMSTSFASSQSLQAAGMIGRSVLAPGSNLSLQNGSAAGGFTLSQPVDHAVVSIKDAAGNVVHSMDMGAQKTGNVMFSWDGATDSGAAAPNGTYTFSVSALQAGQKVAADTLSLGTVNSVSLNASGVTLNTDVLGAVDVSKVTQIF